MVNQALERLETAGIIEPIEFSEWAAPIVPVVKRDGSIRVCGDYKLTMNKAAQVDAYLFPLLEDLFASGWGTVVQQAGPCPCVSTAAA